MTYEDDILRRFVEQNMSATPAATGACVSYTAPGTGGTQPPAQAGTSWIIIIGLLAGLLLFSSRRR